MGFWQNIKEKLKNGIVIIGYSFSTMWKDKNYFSFFFLSLITFMLIILGILFLIEHTVTIKEAFNFLEDISRKKTTEGKVATSFGNLFIFLGSLIIVNIIGIGTTTFFGVATSYYTFKSFEEQPVTVWHAMRHSLSRWWIIVKWSIMATFVQVLINMVRESKKKNGFFIRFLIARLGDIIEIAWYLTTFLVPPVLAFENLGAYASIKRSAMIMKKTFGDTIVADMGFSVLSLFIIVIFPIAWFIGFIASAVFIFVPLGIMAKGPTSFTLFMWATPSIIVPIIGLFFISIAKTIFKTAVYAYAQGRPTGSFPVALIKANFYEKKEKQEKK